MGSLSAGQAKTVSIPPIIVSGSAAPPHGTLIRWFGAAFNDFGDRAFVTGATRVGLTADGDFDGMPDDFEHAYGLDPNDPGDAGGDPDLDGLTNFEEFEAGTDPNDPDSDADGIRDGLDAQPAVASNLCTASNALLQNLLVPAGTVSQCGAESSIAVAATVSVEAGGLLVLTSPAIRMAQGFALPQGAKLRAQAADPAP